jgi:hypothetical protein
MALKIQDDECPSRKTNYLLQKVDDLPCEKPGAQGKVAAALASVPTRLPRMSSPPLTISLRTDLLPGAKIFDQRNFGTACIAGSHVIFIHEGPGKIDSPARADEQSLRRERIR